MASSLLPYKAHEYVRDLDFHENYLRQSARYVSIMKDIDYDTALHKLKVLSEDKGPIAPVIPRVRMNYRPHSRTDRVVKDTDLATIIRTIDKKQLLLGPNLVVYDNPKNCLAYNSEFIARNIQDRNKLKKEAHVAADDGDIEIAKRKGKEQVTKKISNNSQSGAHLSEHNTNFCASAHTTLTSTCRTLTSYSNSMIERLFMGNRHYHSPEVALENLVATIELTDSDKVQKVMDKYNLRYPTNLYARDHILDSCSKYWYLGYGAEDIINFIDKLTPIQLAQITYTSDLKALIDTNPQFIRQLFSDLTLQEDEIGCISVEETDLLIKEADSYMFSLIMMYSQPDVRGLSFKAIQADSNLYGRLGWRMKRVTQLINEVYIEFFRAFFITDLMPMGVYSIPAAIRNCVVVSDTDSTLFTAQSLVEWYTGGIAFNDITDRVTALASYLDAQCLVHILAKVSRHLGLSDEQLFKLQMKPEFTFPIMIVTNRAKHYTSNISSCEGVVYDKWKLDTKGVALKSSKVPTWIMDIFDTYLAAIMEKAMLGESFTPMNIIAPIALLEHLMIEELYAGKSNFLYNEKILDPAAYKQGEDQPKLNYVRFWNYCFGDKYGDMGDYPILTKKVSVDLSNATKLEKWCNQLDQDIADKIRKFSKDYNFQPKVMILVPTEYLTNNSIPEEILKAATLESTLVSLTESFYYIAEALGVYYKNPKLTRFAYHEMDKATAMEHTFIDVVSMYNNK